MGDATGEAADAFEALGFEELIAEDAFAGDVDEGDDYGGGQFLARGEEGLVVQGLGDEGDPDAFAAGFENADGDPGLGVAAGEGEGDGAVFGRKFRAILLNSGPVQFRQTPAGETGGGDAEDLFGAFIRGDDAPGTGAGPLEDENAFGHGADDGSEEVFAFAERAENDDDGSGGDKQGVAEDAEENEGVAGEIEGER